MQKPLLIVGIDPGTTLGYALLDIDGNVVSIESSKQLDLNLVIKEITSIGKPIIVGTDKKRIPDFIDKFSIKVGAKSIMPPEDLPVAEKREMTAGYDYKNSHQMDSLASALYAYKEISSLIRKINLFVEKEDKQDIANKLKELVIKEGISIKTAVDMLEKKEDKKLTIIKKVVQEKKLEKKDYLELYNNLKREERSNRLLKAQNSKLAQQLNSISQKYEYIKGKVEQIKTDEKAEQLLKLREDRIHSLAETAGAVEEQKSHLNKEIDILRDFLSNTNTSIVMKKLKNLGSEEYEKKKQLLNIQPEDVLLVDDPNTHSSAVINSLKNIIICKKNPSKKLNFKSLMLYAENIEIKEDKHFAVIDREDFNKLKKQSNILSQIVDTYKKEKNEQH